MSGDNLQLLSVIIPARNEEENIRSAVNNLHQELARESVPHEILVVDDGSSDGSWAALQELQAAIPELRAARFWQGRNHRVGPDARRCGCHHDGR
jgi:dolichol-phosphate mannosyltransferase